MSTHYILLYEVFLSYNILVFMQIFFLLSSIREFVKGVVALAVLTLTRSFSAEVVLTLAVFLNFSY